MPSIVTAIIAAGRNWTIDYNAGEACDVVIKVFTHIKTAWNRVRLCSHCTGWFLLLCKSCSGTVWTRINVLLWCRNCSEAFPVWTEALSVMQFATLPFDLKRSFSKTRFRCNFCSDKVFRLDPDRLKNLSDTERSTFKSGAEQYCSGAEIASKAVFLVWTEALSGTLSASLRFTIRYSVNIASETCLQRCLRLLQLYGDQALAFCVKVVKVLFPHACMHAVCCQCVHELQTSLCNFLLINWTIWKPRWKPSGNWWLVYLTILWACEIQSLVKLILKIWLIVSRAVFSRIRTGKRFLVSSVYSFCISCGCHIIKLLSTDCLVNAERYSSLRSVRTSELRSEYFSALTKQSVNNLSAFCSCVGFIFMISISSPKVTRV